MEFKTLDFSRFFLISDIHMGVRANSLEWIENQKEYFYNFLIPLIKDKAMDEDKLFILGDVFDNRQSIDTLVNDTSQDIIYDLSKVIEVHILCGNHDMYKRVDNKVNSLRTFTYFNNVYVYTENTMLSNTKGQKILVLPYSEEYDADVEIIQKSGCDYLFAHADILGMKLDNGSDVKKGLNLSKTDVKKVYSGHIHKRQEKGRIVYIGSPYHTKRSDIGDEKGVYLFDAVNNTHEFLFNTVSPIFRKINLSSILDKSVGEVKDMIKNNYVDIIVPLIYTNSFNISTFVDSIKGCGYKRIESALEKRISIDNTDKSVIGITDVSKISILDIFETYVKSDTVIESDEDKRKILELVNKYYKLANINE